MNTTTNNGQYEVSDLDSASPKLASLFRFLFDSRVLFNTTGLVDFSDEVVFSAAVTKYGINSVALRRMLGYHLGMIAGTDQTSFDNNEKHIQNKVYRGILMTQFLDEHYGFFGDGFNMMYGLTVEDDRKGFNSELLSDKHFQVAYSQGFSDISDAYCASGGAVARFFQMSRSEILVQN